MLENLRQANRKKIFIAAGLLTLLVGGWLLFGPYGALQHYRISREREAVLAENERIRQENVAMQGKIVKIKTNPATLEEVARQQFGLIKKNEVVYELPEKKKKRPE